MVMIQSLAARQKSKFPIPDSMFPFPIAIRRLSMSTATCSLVVRREQSRAPVKYFVKLSLQW